MNDDMNLSDGDRDLRLARLIGKRLEAGSIDRDTAAGEEEQGAVRSDPDPQPHPHRDAAPRRKEDLARTESPDAERDDATFLRALLAWRGQVVEEREMPSAESTSGMWRRIEEGILAPIATSRLRPADHREPATRRDRSTRRGNVTRLEDRSPDRAAARSRRRVWMSIAAGLVVGGIIGVLAIREPAPALVASADAGASTYTAADGSIVTLRPHSRLYLVAESDEEVRYRIEGEGLFEVAAVLDRGTFAVEAGEALVEVLGTRFNLSTWGEAAVVYLEEGSLRFSNRATGEDVVLAPGQASRITSAGPPSTAAEEPAAEHLDWIAGELQFRQRTAGSIAAELEHHFNIDLTISQPIQEETLSGRILLDERAQSLADFAEVLGGRFVEAGPNTYRFERE